MCATKMGCRTKVQRPILFYAQRLSGYNPFAVFSAMAATTIGLSAMYVTPYHVSELLSTFTRAFFSSRSCVITVGRKNSPFIGFSAIALSKNSGKRETASSIKLRVRPQRFKETTVSPESAVQLFPPSKLKRASFPSFSPKTFN